MRKKVNPRRRVITAYDVKKAQRQAETESVRAAWAIMFSVLRDKFDWSPDDLQKLWDHVESLAESVTKGYIKIDDLMRVLEEEDSITLK